MPGSTSQTIVLSNDDIDILKGLQWTLEDWGFSSVYIAPTVAETLEIVMSTTPGLIITDIQKNASEPNGQEMARFIKAQSPLARVPILLLTGHENYPWDRDVFCAYVPMPIDRWTFVQLVRWVLAGQPPIVRATEHHAGPPHQDEPILLPASLRIMLP